MNITLGPWPKGMNNIRRRDALEDDQLGLSVNWDIDDTGRLSVRAGYRKVYTGTPEVGTLWSGRHTYFVENGNLLQFHPDYSTTVLRSGVGSGPMAYLELNEQVYYSNGSVSGRLVDGVARPWGLPGPVQQPVIRPASGSLTPGTYQVAITFVDSDGLESGTGVAATHVSPGGGMLLTQIEQPPAGQRVRVYVSTANGEKLYYFNEIDSGTELQVSAVSNQTGRLLETQFMAPPPAGQHLAYCNGRIYIAQGPVVYCTEPYQYNHVNPMTGFWQYGSDVTLLAATTSRVYVADQTDTYAVSGMDTDALVNRKLFPFSAVPGTLTKLPKADHWAWFCPEGFVLATGEQIDLLSREKVAVSSAERGAMLYREQDGHKQLLASLAALQPNPYIDKEFAATELARRAL